jgi:hypothetical protein
MKLTVIMPEVAECEVIRCAYNTDRRCHARAITVGDSVHPECDTFLGSNQHCIGKDSLAGVGACKVTGCRYNKDLECEAEAIRIGYHDQHADCMTFAPR